MECGTQAPRQHHSWAWSHMSLSHPYRAIKTVLPASKRCQKALVPATEAQIPESKPDQLNTATCYLCIMVTEGFCDRNTCSDRNKRFFLLCHHIDIIQIKDCGFYSATTGKRALPSQQQPFCLNQTSNWCCLGWSIFICPFFPLRPNRFIYWRCSTQSLTAKLHVRVTLSLPFCFPFDWHSIHLQLEWAFWPGSVWNSLLHPRWKAIGIHPANPTAALRPIDCASVSHRRESARVMWWAEAPSCRKHQCHSWLHLDCVPCGTVVRMQAELMQIFDLMWANAAWLTHG